jgi:hypothetical protein
MENMQSAVDSLVHSSNTLFILLGAVMVLAMHAGFAFLEVGTVRQKNQVNALSKILSDFAVSTLAYFFIGYWVSYGVTFVQPAAALAADHGYGLVKFFFLLTFAAAIPAIISGGIAERARFAPQLAWPGTATSACKLGCRAISAPVSTTLPVPWWFMPWVAGWRWPLSFCSDRVTGATGTGDWWHSPRRAFHSWRWVRGS